MSKEKKNIYFLEPRITNKSATLFITTFFSLVENISSWTYTHIHKTPCCTVQVSFTRFIYEFYDSRILEYGLPLAAVAFSPLHPSPYPQRSPPYTGCIKSWKMDILIRAYIDKQSLLLRLCLLSPWWFMGDAYRVYYARNNISLTRDSRTFG